MASQRELSLRRPSTHRHHPSLLPQWGWWYICALQMTPRALFVFTHAAQVHVHTITSMFLCESVMPAGVYHLSCLFSIKFSDVSLEQKMVVKHLLKKKALLCFRRERKKTHKNRGDEVKEKSPINSGNGTCGAGLCFPNIPADWGGWEKGCETVGEGWVYADGGGLRGNEWEQTEMEGVGGVKCREWDRLWRKHGEGEWARGVRLRVLISRWLHSEEHV